MVYGMRAVCFPGKGPVLRSQELWKCPQMHLPFNTCHWERSPQEDESQDRRNVVSLKAEASPSGHLTSLRRAWSRHWIILVPKPSPQIIQGVIILQLTTPKGVRVPQSSRDPAWNDLKKADLLAIE